MKYLVRNNESFKNYYFDHFPSDNEVIYLSLGIFKNSFLNDLKMIHINKEKGSWLVIFGNKEGGRSAVSITVINLEELVTEMPIIKIPKPEKLLTEEHPLIRDFAKYLIEKNGKHNERKTSKTN